MLIIVQVLYSYITLLGDVYVDLERTKTHSNMIIELGHPCADWLWGWHIHFRSKSSGGRLHKNMEAIPILTPNTFHPLLFGFLSRLSRRAYFLERITSCE